MSTPPTTEPIEAPAETAPVETAPASTVIVNWKDDPRAIDDVIHHFCTGTPPVCEPVETTVAVAPSSTSAPLATELPVTGASETLMLVAAVILAAGGAMVRMARRPG